MDRAFLNVMMLSWGFMLVFTAFQTMGNIEVSENVIVVDRVVRFRDREKFEEYRSLRSRNRSFTLERSWTCVARFLNFL